MAAIHCQNSLTHGLKKKCNIFLVFKTPKIIIKININNNKVLIRCYVIIKLIQIQLVYSEKTVFYDTTHTMSLFRINWQNYDSEIFHSKVHICGSI